MPHEREYASKCSHVDILKNPDVQAFLEECEYMKEPTEAEGSEISAAFEIIDFEDVETPQYLLAWDGSRYETSPEPGSLPCTQSGVVKVSGFLLNLHQLKETVDDEFGLIDPVEYSKCVGDNVESLHFIFPGANMRYRKSQSVADGFRKALDHWLHNERSVLTTDDGKQISLASTLFMLANLRDNSPGDGKIRILKCPDPSCNYEDKDGTRRLGLTLDLGEDNRCPQCGTIVYPTDVLRLHEDITPIGSNIAAYTRTMQTLEHLLMVHFVRYFFMTTPHYLQNMVFFIDGPLASFGPPAWTHSAILRYLHHINRELAKKGLKGPMVIGIQKTGEINDYMGLANKHIPSGAVMALSDDFRYEKVMGGMEKASNGFGYETYYGQDFVFKTPEGQIMTFNLPYHIDQKPKTGNKKELKEFNEEKADIKNYPDIPKALKLLCSLQASIYKGATVPTTLGNRYAAISLKPGGKVLDIFTNSALKK